METLTQRLRRELETCPLPLNAVAREAEILQPVLWRFVKGDGGISLQTADKLCDFFDVFPDDEQSKL
jgi:hypothetical protein